MKYAILLTLVFTASLSAADTHYVSPAGSNEQPYWTWETAAHVIQDAIDVAAAGDVILVTNGTYSTGGKAGYATGGNAGQVTRVVLNKAVTLRSVNGPDVTTVQGATPVRCVYVGDGATIEGFTLSGARQSTWFDGGGIYMTGGGRAFNCVVESNHGNSGGGVYGGTIHNSIIRANWANKNGGGAYNSTLVNCIIVNNDADAYFSSGGGGTYGGVSSNCTYAGNSTVGNGGGAYGGILINCIVYHNSDGNTYGSDCSHCCTIPLPSGTGNIEAPPLMVDWVNGDYTLQSNSPCIDVGMFASGGDFSGTPRPLDGDNDSSLGSDIGAYELVNPMADSDQDGLLDTIEISGLHGTSAVKADTDGDHQNDGDEVVAGTSPTSADSVFRILSLARSDGTAALTWSTVNLRGYRVQIAEAVSGPWSNLFGFAVYELDEAPEGTETILHEQQGPPRFYKVVIE